MTEQIQAERQQEARDLNRDPITGTPGAHPVGTGIGAAGGAAAGAAMGLLAGGPIGTAVGGVVGAVVGGLAGKGVGEAVNPTADEVVMVDIVAREPVATAIDPTAEDLYWQRAFVTEPYYNSELSYDDYAPAYRIGIKHRQNNAAQGWDEVEGSLQSEWERSKGESRLSWDDAYHPIRAAWFRADSSLAGGDPYFGVT
jgi:hypothetical protein